MTQCASLLFFAILVTFELPEFNIKFRVNHGINCRIRWYYCLNWTSVTSHGFYCPSEEKIFICIQKDNRSRCSLNLEGSESLKQSHFCCFSFTPLKLSCSIPHPEKEWRLMFLSLSRWENTPTQVKRGQVSYNHLTHTHKATQTLDTGLPSYNYPAVYLKFNLWYMIDYL